MDYRPLTEEKESGVS